MTPFYVINTKKIGLQIMSLAAYASETNQRSTEFIKWKILYENPANLGVG